MLVILKQEEEHLVMGPINHILIKQRQHKILERRDRNT